MCVYVSSRMMSKMFFKPFSFEYFQLFQHKTTYTNYTRDHKYIPNKFLTSSYSDFYIIHISLIFILKLGKVNLKTAKLVKVNRPSVIKQTTRK